MNGKRVWAVVDGDYSDYHVIGVFSTAKNAKLIQAKTGGSVVVWPLDPCVDAINSGLRPWRVLMLRDGTVESIREEDVSGGYDLSGRVEIWRRTQAYAYGNTDTQDCLDVKAWAKDEKHAVKIANEHRTRLIGTGQWR